MSIKGIKVEGELGKALMDALEKKCEKVRVGEHKMSAEHKKIWKEFLEKADEALALRKEAERLKNKFWNKVEGDLEIFDKSLKVNYEEGLIEVYEDNCENCEEK